MSNIDLNTDSSDQNQITPPNVSPANKENDEKLVWVVCDDVAPSTTADLGGVSTAVPDDLIAVPDDLIAVPDDLIDN